MSPARPFRQFLSACLSPLAVFSSGTFFLLVFTVSLSFLPAILRSLSAIHNLSPGSSMFCSNCFGDEKYRYDTGTISGILAMDYFQKEFATQKNMGVPELTSNQTSLIVSILSAGTFFGALTASPFGDQLGRRMGLIVSCLIFSIGVAFQVAATAIPLLGESFFAFYPSSPHSVAPKFGRLN